MATTLTALRDRVEQILADSSNAIWATGDVDEAIRQALHQYSAANPQHKITTITLSADDREISTSTITDVVAIEEIWCPYNSSNPQYPPYKRPFRFWKDSAILYVLGQYIPQSSDVVRVFYAALHTLSGLDSATATTLPDEHATTVALGAAGHAAASRALDLTEQVTVDRDAVARLTTWAQHRLATFEADLRTIAVQAQGPGHVPLPALDRHDDTWA
jgi:hypothetical protein